MIGRLRIVTLVCLLAGCGTSEAAPEVEHAPVQLDDTQRSVVAALTGPWAHVGGAQEQAAAVDAVSSVTAELNALIRGVAQSRLEESVRIDATLEIAEAEGIVTITRSERKRPFVAPASGLPFDTLNDEDDEAKGSLRIEGNTLVTRLETEDGGGQRVYRIDDEGKLEITTTIFSPRLPGEVVYVAHYTRP